MVFWRKKVLEWSRIDVTRSLNVAGSQTIQIDRPQVLDEKQIMVIEIFCLLVVSPSKSNRSTVIEEKTPSHTNTGKFQSQSMNRIQMEV